MYLTCFDRFEVLAHLYYTLHTTIEIGERDWFRAQVWEGGVNLVMLMLIRFWSASSDITWPFILDGAISVLEFVVCCEFPRVLEANLAVDENLWWQID